MGYTSGPNRRGPRAGAGTAACTSRPGWRRGRGGPRDGLFGFAVGRGCEGVLHELLFWTAAENGFLTDIMGDHRGLKNEEHLMEHRDTLSGRE